MVFLGEWIVLSLFFCKLNFIKNFRWWIWGKLDKLNNWLMYLIRIWESIICGGILMVRGVLFFF